MGVSLANVFGEKYYEMKQLESNSAKLRELSKHNISRLQVCWMMRVPYLRFGNIYQLLVKASSFFSYKFNYS